MSRPEIDGYEALLQQERTKANSVLELEICGRRDQADAALQKERQLLNEQREALDREKETLVQTLEGAANRFTTGRSEFLSDFLALVPALQSTGVLQTAGQGQLQAVTSEAPDVPPPLPAAFAQAIRTQPSA